MSSYQKINDALAADDYAALARQIPYAAYLGIQIESQAGVRRYRLPFREDLVGNGRIQALHGGVVAGFLELSAQFEVLISQRQRRVPGPIDFAVDYLRSAKSVDSFVNCRLLRQGRRVAHVQAQCWQTDPAKPVAFARMNFLLQDVPQDQSSENQ